MGTDDALLPLSISLGADKENVVDVSERNLELSIRKCSPDSVNGLYIYKNTFNLIPRAIGDFTRLRTLKFFSNEVNAIPNEAGELEELECLHVKVSSPAVSGFAFRKLKSLKELELRRIQPKLSAPSILTEIAALKYLSKLSVCHFSIRYLPSEIGCLKNLEELDSSFNKLKNLPDDIASLSSLRVLRVANNKLVELPSGLSHLRVLDTLDLSNNRLTSLKSLDLSSMNALRQLNLQYNRLFNCYHIPSWICCNLEGNGKDIANGEVVNLSDTDVVDAYALDADQKCIYAEYQDVSSTTKLSATSSSCNRCSITQRPRKGWKRLCIVQEGACCNLTNCSRRRREDYHCDSTSTKLSPQDSIPTTVDKPDLVADRSSEENNETLLLKHCKNHPEDVETGSGNEISSSDVRQRESKFRHKKEESEASDCSGENAMGTDVGLSLEASSSINNANSKRHSDRYLDNPKPSKCRKPVDECFALSCKYSSESFCSSRDRLPDGFYDAGRDRPFMTLQNYEHSLSFDSREVILVDRESDEELDAIALSAHILVSNLKNSETREEANEDCTNDILQRASVLALFVSDCFGGSDRSNTIGRMRKAAAGLAPPKPFICTCSGPASNHSDSTGGCRQICGTIGNFDFVDLCEKSIRLIKEARSSSIVPLGTLRFGVCRHRALLMKYLCDRAVPPIPCELVRGYLEFMPHAWNVILVKRGESVVRMVVDTCHPTDIREETNLEYFCRYIPLTRILVPTVSGSLINSKCAFPSVSLGKDNGNPSSGIVIPYHFGTLVAAAKVRTFAVMGMAEDEIRNFEYSCLGEVRILNVLRNHSCIVEMYGHQLRLKWVTSPDGNKDHRVLQFKIVLEYVKGGSLKGYLEKLSDQSDKRVPLRLVLSVARDVACALAEVHSKQIIHRDIKSENVLIDLDSTRKDGSPVVKLCDFDRAVPVDSPSHMCCIGHFGIVPPDACVGTPRWMAPEVLQSMHTHNRYGLEVDIWSYGCLLLELLTLQVPYAGLSLTEIDDMLQRRQRPLMTPELEALLDSEEQDGLDLAANASFETDVEMLRFLVRLFFQCTRPDPTDRPNAKHIYEMLCSAFSSLSTMRT